MGVKLEAANGKFSGVFKIPEKFVLSQIKANLATSLNEGSIGAEQGSAILLALKKE